MEVWGFNQALLAKEGVKLLQKPSSMVGRVFKGKYLPTTDVLEASMGHCLAESYVGQRALVERNST